MGTRRTTPTDGPGLPVEDYWQDHFRIAKWISPPAGSHVNDFHTFAPTYALIDKFNNTRYIIPRANEAARREYIERGLYTPDILYHRNKTMIEVHNKSLKLAHPFPIPLSKPPITAHFELVCRTNDGRYALHLFHARYAAKAFLTALIDGKEYKWMNDNKIAISNGISIETPRGQLEELVEYTPDSREILWLIPEPYLTTIRQFLNGGRAISTPGKIEASDQQVGELKVRVAPASPQVTRRPARTADQDVVRTKAKMKIKSGDHITIAQIAQELGKEPRDCRAALRALKIEKPVSGNWAWPPSEAEAIKKRLKGKVK